MTGLTESVVDDTAIEKFKDLGYDFAYGCLRKCVQVQEITCEDN